MRQGVWASIMRVFLFITHVPFRYANTFIYLTPHICNYSSINRKRPWQQSKLIRKYHPCNTKRNVANETLRRKRQRFTVRIRLANFPVTLCPSFSPNGIPKLHVLLSSPRFRILMTICIWINNLFSAFHVCHATEMLDWVFVLFCFWYVSLQLLLTVRKKIKINKMNEWELCLHTKQKRRYSLLPSDRAQCVEVMMAMVMVFVIFTVCVCFTHCAVLCCAGNQQSQLIRFFPFGK